MKFPSHLNCDGKIVSEMGPCFWHVVAHLLGHCSLYIVVLWACFLLPKINVWYFLVLDCYLVEIDLRVFATRLYLKWYWARFLPMREDMHTYYIMLCLLSLVKTHWGLVMPYGVRDLDQHWFRYWLVAWRHQAITWTNVGLSSVRFCGIHLRTLS